MGVRPTVDRRRRLTAQQAGRHLRPSPSLEREADEVPAHHAVAEVRLAGAVDRRRRGGADRVGPSPRAEAPPGGIDQERPEQHGAPGGQRRHPLPDRLDRQPLQERHGHGWRGARELGAGILRPDPVDGGRAGDDHDPLEVGLESSSHRQRSRPVDRQPDAGDAGLERDIPLGLGDFSIGTPGNSRARWRSANRRARLDSTVTSASFVRAYFAAR